MNTVIVNVNRISCLDIYLHMIIIYQRFEIICRLKKPLEKGKLHEHNYLKKKY